MCRERNSIGRQGRDTPSATPGPAGSVQGFRVNPGVARLVFPVSVSAARKGLGSDEETGVRRSNAGLDRPRLHADGARVRQARGGRPPDARPLVPDANRGARPPEVAALVPAGPEGELILERSAGARIFFRAGLGQLTRSVNYPGTRASRHNQDHQLFASVTLTRTGVHSWTAPVRYARGRAGSRVSGKGDDHDRISGLCSAYCRQ